MVVTSSRNYAWLELHQVTLAFLEYMKVHQACFETTYLEWQEERLNLARCLGVEIKESQLFLKMESRQ